MPATLRLPTETDVAAARANIAGYARRTPLWRLDAETPAGVTIWLKLENLQPLGSFKIRAAVNALKSRDPAMFARGVVGASAGNFGLGLALAAKQLGAPVTIVAPETAAETKAEALRRLGATVIRVPFDDWWRVLTTRRFEGPKFTGVDGVFFHPVAEPEVVAGNATIGAEILEDLPRFDAVVVPFGGGGLISGIGSVVRRLAPGARMIAVESASSQPAAAALAAGGPVTVPHHPSFVDGIGSTTVLAEMWPLVRETVDTAVMASFDEIAAAIRLLAQRLHVIAEGAGAAALAAALAGRAGTGDIVCIVSGGNLDAGRLATILAGGTPA
jgi:threonine dehydratase